MSEAGTKIPGGTPRTGGASSVGNAAGQSLRRLRIAILAFGLIVAATFATNEVRHVYAERDNVIDDALFTAETLIQSLDEHLVRTVQGADLVLATAVERIETLLMQPVPDGAGLQAALRVLKAHATQVAALGFTDGVGIIRLDDQDDPMPPLDLSQNDVVAWHRDNPTRDVVVAQPYVNPVTQKVIIPLTRRVDHSDGRFAGVAVVALDPAYFEGFYSRLQGASVSALSMASTTGMLLARIPTGDGQVGIDLQGSPQFQIHLPRSESGRYYAPADEYGPDRHVVYRKVAGLPYVVAARIVEETLLAGWRSNFTSSLLEVSLVTVSLLVLSVFLFVAMGRQERLSVDLAESETRFRDFTEATSDWSWEMDADLKFTSFSSNRIVGRSGSIQDLIGKHRWDVVHVSKQDERWKSHIDDMRAHRPFRDIRQIGYSPDDGTPLHVKISGKPVFDARGVFQGYRGTATDITNEVLAEDQAAYTRWLMDEALGAVTEGFVLFDADDRLVLCNNRFRRLYEEDADLLVPGARFEDLVRRGIERGDAPESAEDPEEWFRRRLDAHKSAMHVYERQRKDGTWIRVQEIRLKDGGHVGVHTDITEAKRREAQLADLAAKNALFAAGIEANSSAVVFTDPTKPGRPITYVNPAFTKLMGYSAEEVIGRSPRFLVDPTGTMKDWKEFDAAIQSGRPLNSRMLHYRKDGTPVYFDLNVSPVRGPEGNLIHIVAIRNDVTAEVEANEKLRQSEARFRDFTEASSDWYWEMDDQFRFTSFSSNWQRISGLRLEDFVRKTRWEGIEAPQADEVWSRHFDDLHSQRQFRDFVYRTKRSDGQPFWIRSSGKPVYDEAGKFTGYRGTATDVTKQVLAEESAARSQRLLFQAVERLNDGFVLYGPDERLVVFNSQYLRMYGNVADTVVPGVHIRDILRKAAFSGLHSNASGREEEWIEERLADYRNGRDDEREMADGRWLLLKPTPLADGGFVAIHSDITAKKHYEAELAELAQRNSLLAAAINANTSAILISDTTKTDRPIVYINPAFTKLTGYSADEAIGRNARFLYGSEAAPASWTKIDEVIRTDRPLSERVLHYRKDGTPIYFDLHISPVYGPDGKTTHIVAVRDDVTAKVEAEEKLRQSEERFRDFTAAASDGYWEMDADLRYTNFSPNNQMPNAADVQSYIGKHRWEFVDPKEQDEAWHRHLDDMSNRRPFRDIRQKRNLPNGNVLYTKLSGKPIFDESGAFSGYRGTATDVTTQILAEENAARSRRLLADAIEGLDDGFVLFDADGYLVMCNSRYRNIHAHVPASILAPGVHVSEIFRASAYSGQHNSAIGREEAWIAERLADYRKAMRHDRQMQDGRWLRLKEVPLPDGNLVAIHSDITAEKRHETELAELARKNALFAAAIETTTSGVVITDPHAEGKPIIYVNPAFAKLTGYTAEEAMGRNIRFLFGPKTDQAALDKIYGAIGRGEPVDARMLHYRKDGGEVYFDINVSPVRDTEGKVTHFVAVEHDVTEKVAAEERLRESEERLRVLADNVPGIIFQRTHRPDGTFYFSYMSERCFDLSGDTAEELRRDPTAIGKRVHPEDALAYRDIFYRAIQEMKPCEYEFRFTHRLTGEMRWARSMFRPRPGANGDVLLDGVVFDITDQKRATEQLRESEERLRLIAENLPGVLFQRITRPDGSGRYTFMSERILEQTGYSSAEFYSEPKIISRLILEEDRPQFEAHMKHTLETMSPNEAEYRIRKKNGEVRWMNTLYSPRRAANGDIVWDGMAFDITHAKRLKRQRRELESQLRHTQKIEALGTLAGGIAHDVNNTLVPIIALTKLTALALPEDSPHRDRLMTVNEAAHRIKSLVSQILAFSRKESPQSEAVDLRKVIADAARLLSATLPVNIRLVQHAMDDVGTIRGDASQLVQVLMNLSTNASHAIGRDKGRIEIDLTATDITDGTNPVAGIPPGRYARLTVTDNGCGMDESTRQRIFEPFFTTKGVGEGTGLGLSVVHGIITSHNGRITVESEVGKGTVFTLLLPLAEAVDAAPIEPPAHAVSA